MSTEQEPKIQIAQKVYARQLYGEALKEYYREQNYDESAIIIVDDDSQRGKPETLFCHGCGSTGPFELDIPYARQSLIDDIEANKKAKHKKGYLRSLDEFDAALSSRLWVRLDHAGRLVISRMNEKINVKDATEIINDCDLLIGEHVARCPNCKDHGTVDVPDKLGFGWDDYGVHGNEIFLTDQATGVDGWGNPVITREGIMDECIGCYNFSDVNQRVECGDNLSDDELMGWELPVAPCHLMGSNIQFDGLCPHYRAFFDFEISTEEIITRAKEVGKWASEEALNPQKSPTPKPLSEILT